MECFSQNKDEMVLGFAAEDYSLYIRANLSPSVTCLSFPEDYKRSKKNSVDLFPDIIGEKVTKVHPLAYERAMLINFESGKALLFKLHGNRSNIILYKDPTLPPSSVFRNELKEDQALLIKDLENPLDLSHEHFILLEGKAAAFLPTLGKIPRAWLKSKGYITAGIEEKWKLMQEVMDMLETPLFSITKENTQYALSLLPENNSIFSSIDPIEAANEYFRHAVVFQAFDREKKQISKTLEDQKKKTASYIKKTRTKLQDLEGSASPSQLADIIMANLHQIPLGTTEVELFDFYQNKNITVKIKKGSSPQKQAENLYRKSKNRKIELEQLHSNLSEKELLFLELEELLNELNEIQDFKSLRDFAKSNQINQKSQEQSVNLPFKRLELEGFEVLIGKSAKANDQMLRYYSWKDDLWLHAKDVSGSHVIIKFKSGQTIPKSTIERAAELAAFYSKNKNESLAPVIYTPCKYVRKVKGSPAGAVMVDKEKVIMVSPKGP
ncbi:NFACT RNA binding domain-containing protein [Echinicola salinicaeni]|uniref:NFACT RNA binding domain-containing protein n=1 Tax=Echinicola salinicaeni TaxID=2762757 RepID=UPI00293BC5BC|nr:NFACT RNA binding domain-containing protein [Echinicola salinicaeni]